MGVALSQPVTSKRLYREGNELFRVGVASMQGAPLSLRQCGGRARPRLPRRRLASHAH